VHNNYAEYRVNFDSLFEGDMTSAEARHVVDNFDSKLKEVRSQGRGNVADMATKLWNYFGSEAVPNQAKALAGVALLYFILPYDLVPDATPLLGYADDLAMMAVALRRASAMVGIAKSSRENFRDHYNMP
jgi:uncharacterized membrane protein YkvA (DUF1232 family)